MIHCPACSSEQAETSEFCSACGAALKAEIAATVTHGPAGGASGGGSHSSAADSSHHGRFLPGTKIADRYRIVSLVGKGGMGEVYRADDLALGHTVALKFLPDGLADDPQRLELFHSEVRLTRQISHPNVCRVYDIGEMDGQKFLSMEYIDGEDLRVLLRRIGKLPGDKGVQIAQQLCAGLAAAHEKGVLHRDLKPANIMLDGRGQVRITDFGLAKLAEEAREGEFAGTPAYMAPEQLARGEATIQSDLYSLGLILYEVFTGEAARKPAPIPELIRANEESALSQTLVLPSDVDPAVQRAISRCLEQEPHERPISAKAVAASLPGGDPLAAALAAGETPSPELVAAAGTSGLLSLKAASIYLSVVIVGLALLVHFAGALSPAKDLEEPEVFASKAREILENLGHEPANYEKYQFELVKGQATEKREILNEEAEKREVLEFWYRCSPKHLFQEEADMFLLRSQVTLTNPPLSIPEMAAVVLNRDQTLRTLQVVPAVERKGVRPLLDIRQEGTGEEGAGREDARQKAEERFNQQLAAIVEPAFKQTVPPADRKIDGRVFEPSRYTVLTFPPERAPMAVDDYFFFQPKPDAGLPDIERIEVALADRKVVYFNVVPTPPKVENNSGQTWTVLTATIQYWKKLLSPIEDWTNGLSATISLLLLPVTMALAWRNSRLGRSDRRTAWRVAVFVFCVVLLGRRLDCGLTFEMFRNSLMLAAGAAFQIWVYYLALEPIVRKFWPGILTAWSRAMTGRWRDPSLGHSLLIGATMATLVPLLYVLLDGFSREFKASALSGNAALLMVVTLLIRFVVTGWGIYITMILVLCRVIVRSDWLAAGLACALLMVFWFFDHVVAPKGYTIVVLVYLATVMFFLIRFGVVAAYSFLFCHHLLIWMPIGDDLQGPDLAPTILAVATVLAIAGYGFYTSVGGRRCFENLAAAKASLGAS